MEDHTNLSAAPTQTPFDIGFATDQKYMIYLIGAFALAGLYSVGTRVYSFIRLLLSLFVLPGKPLKTFGPKGSWALITGASDGIGREFSMQLSQKGFNILLVSRTTSKLEAVAQEIHSHAGSSSAQTKVFSLDLNTATPDTYNDLKSIVQGLDVSILINCAGKSHDIPIPFALASDSETQQIINTNCTGTLQVTSLVLPGMISRKRGLILTMGSFSGLLPTPLLAPYSGSKAFLQYWSTALGSELEPHGITVELVQSYLVTSAMSKVRKPSLFIPNPRAFVKATLAKIGRSGGAQRYAYTSTPYWSHGVMQYLIGMIGHATGDYAVTKNREVHESIRKRALKKRERDNGKKVS